MSIRRKRGLIGQSGVIIKPGGIGSIPVVTPGVGGGGSGSNLASGAIAWFDFGGAPPTANSGGDPQGGNLIESGPKICITCLNFQDGVKNLVSGAGLRLDNASVTWRYEVKRLTNQTVADLNSNYCGNTDYTIGIKFQVPNFSAEQGIVCLGHNQGGTTAGGWSMRVNTSGQVVIQLYGANQVQTFTSTETVTAGALNTVSFSHGTKGGGKFRMCVNGVLESQQNVTITPTNHTTREPELGCYRNHSVNNPISPPLNPSYIDDFVIWDRALKANEMSSFVNDVTFDGVFPSNDVYPNTGGVVETAPNYVFDFGRPIDCCRMSAYNYGTNNSPSDGQAPEGISSVCGGIVATQGTASRKAVYKENIINGRGVLRFDGTDDYYQIGNPSVPINTLFDITDVTVLAVVKMDPASSGSSTILMFGRFGPQQLSCLVNRASGVFMWEGANALIAGGTILDDGQFHVVGYRKDASETTIWHAGTKLATSTSQVITKRDALAFGAEQGPNAPFHGDIAEVDVWNIALSDADMAHAMGRLATKYGL